MNLIIDTKKIKIDSMKTIYKFWVPIVIFLMVTNLNAQDIHLSQYDASPILLNPALTGMLDKGDFRLATNYRTQWASVSSSSFTTTGIAFDTKLKPRWGVGAYATNNDLAGFINVFNFAFSGSYQITDPTQNKYKITTGLQVGFLLKSLNPDEFVFDSQYEDGSFNTSKLSGENFTKTNSFSPDFNWGIAYVHTDESWKIKPFAGLSLFHLSLPNESFTDGDSDNLPIRWVFNGGVKYKINEKVNLKARSLFMLQRKAKEFNFGALVEYRIKDTEYILLGGIDVRWDDALIFSLGLNHKNISYRLSYDITTSSLQSVTGGRGGGEISIVYTPNKHKVKADNLKNRVELD